MQVIVKEISIEMHVPVLIVEQNKVNRVVRREMEQFFYDIHTRRYAAD